jgi:hypothetical protein
MSLLTFVRKNRTEEIQVAEAIRAINRLLERAYPDCTCAVLKVGEFGLASEWVTVELEITRESLGCPEWYTRQAAAQGLALKDWRSRQAVPHWPSGNAMVARLATTCRFIFAN